MLWAATRRLSVAYIARNGKSMRRPRRSTAGVAVSALTASLLLTAGPATAAPPTRITEPIDFTFTDTDFCGTGQSVEIVGEGEERVQVAQRRGQTYFSARVRLEQTFSNTATGATITTREVSRFRDLHITDNGDGTLTIVNFGTGFFMMYDADGRIIGKNTGQSRFETRIDLNGTPDDFDDDTVISDELILGSTGTNDDFCEAAVSALT
jgi:hypothetical protein